MGWIFGELLNVKVDECISVVPNGKRIPVCWKCNDEIGYHEIIGAVRSLKRDKSPCIDEVSVVYLKRGGDCGLELLLRMFKGCFREGKVLRKWKRACIVPLYKGKGVLLNVLTIGE